MDDLLKKKKNLLDKSNAPRPTSTFSNEHASASKETKPKVKTTTVRCTVDVSTRLSALVTTQGYESVNELLEKMIDFYEGNLTAEERIEIRQIEKVLSRKRQ